MSKEWLAVDRYIVEMLVGSDPVLDAALEASAEAGFPPIQVSANQGKLLQLLARVRGARTILEIGTLGGYSTIWLARALPPDGSLVTLEVDPRHAEVATANLARAGLGDVVDLRLGRAVDTLAQLDAEGAGPFDLVFVDADKPSNRDPSVEGVRRLNELMAGERRVSATAIQTVGSKGYDGFAVALVTAGE